MISPPGKYLWALLLALGLPSISACNGLESNTPVQSKATATTPLASATHEPRFAIPINCNLGQDCFILLYPDRDPGPEAVDFGCGRQTYDGHSGTDFAIPDEQIMAKGVAVKAAAAGRVLRVRDGVPDQLIQNQTDKDAVNDIECGNGVVIDHGGGWETQYCHLRNGSVAVEAGTQVEKGTVLGMVGASGLASFPHVHLSIRYQGQVVDPFVGPEAGSGCNVARESLWERPLDYLPTGPIRAGFASQPPKMEELWEGRFSETLLSKDIPVLLFWVHVYGILKGDVVHFKLTAPNGQVIAEDQREVDDSSRTWIGYVGKRNNPQRPIIPGIWRGEYKLMRSDRVLLELSRQIEVR